MKLYSFKKDTTEDVICLAQGWNRFIELIPNVFASSSDMSKLIILFTN